jgi:hypothetical protein
VAEEWLIFDLSPFPGALLKGITAAADRDEDDHDDEGQ